MSRSKLLLLTLAISSAIHLALAAGVLLLDSRSSTPSARAVVEISLQQAATVETSNSPVQQPEPIIDEAVLSSQQDNVNQHVIADTDSMPEPQIAKRIETEAESVADPSVQAPPTDETLAQSPVAETDSEATPASLQPAHAGQQNAEHSSALEAEKQNYLGLVAEHINSYKYYPRSAIRRVTEGQVEVSFDLQPDGSIENLRTQGEHSVLLSASQRSIEQALPMPQRSENLLALGTIHIEFSMKYFLHEQ
jgi:outer membrane biosynthesis protein TonB